MIDAGYGILWVLRQQRGHPRFQTVSKSELEIRSSNCLLHAKMEPNDPQFPRTFPRVRMWLPAPHGAPALQGCFGAAATWRDPKVRQTPRPLSHKTAIPKNRSVGVSQSRVWSPEHGWVLPSVFPKKKQHAKRGTPSPPQYCTNIVHTQKYIFSEGTSRREHPKAVPRALRLRLGSGPAHQRQQRRGQLLSSAPSPADFSSGTQKKKRSDYPQTNMEAPRPL